MIIVFIWVLALSLASPMAMSWEVIMVDEQDPGKEDVIFLYRFKRLFLFISYFFIF